MPTWRTSVGRALTPGKAPTIGQARDLPLAAQMIHAVPGREGLAIESPGEPRPIDLKLSLPWVLKDNFAIFKRPGPITILTPPEPHPGPTGELSPEADLGRVIREAASPQPPETWAWILPLIEAPAVWSVPAPQLEDYRLRAYQVEAVRQIVTDRGILLADDLGLGKTVEACSAIYSLVQRGRVHQVLIVCSPPGLRHWLAHLRAWAPGLLVCPVVDETGNDGNPWRARAHAYLTDHASMITAFQSGALTEAGLSFDMVVVDDLISARTTGGKLWDVLDQLRPSRRMVLTGAPPGPEDFWLSVFDFLFPQPAATETEPGLMASSPQPPPITIVRRTKADVARELPRRTRVGLWVDLEGEQRQSYHRAIADERRRLVGLGEAVSPAHVELAVDRLAHAVSYGDSPGEGAKARLLVQLLEDIVAAGAKALVVVNDRTERQAGLAVTLDRFGTANVDTARDELSRIHEIERFRTDPETHLLLGGIEQVVEFGPIPELSYIIHVDPHWNPAIRDEAEARLRPETGPGLPVHVYELWAAATFEAQMFAFMQERARLYGGAAAAAAELSRQDWLEGIIEIGKAASASGAPLVWTSDSEALSGVLPDKTLVVEMDPGELTKSVTRFIHALGFPEIEQLFGNSPAAVDLLAWREVQGRIERILVRCLTEEGSAGIADVRLALDLLKDHQDISRAYLVGIGDFSAAAKKAAEDSEGKLELITGAELARHLRLLGKPPDERAAPGEPS